MPTANSNSNGINVHYTDQLGLGSPVLPPWMVGPSSAISSPSVTLSLSPLTGPTIPWPQNNNNNNNNNNNGNDSSILSEIVECCREMEEGHRAWATHRKEAAWRLKRVELQLESEKACRRREKMEEIEAKVRALREEEKVVLERIEGEYREQLAGLRREAEGKEQKLADQWAAKHLRLTKFLEQMGWRDRV